MFMHVFDVSSDALLHCYAVDEQENGEAIHLFKSMKAAIGTNDAGYSTFDNDKSHTEMNNQSLFNKSYQ